VNGEPLVGAVHETVAVPELLPTLVCTPVGAVGAPPTSMLGEVLDVPPVQLLAPITSSPNSTT
jgi:hypothetical protein